MSDVERQNPGLSRRKFIFGAAATAADGAWELSGRTGIVRSVASFLKGKEATGWRGSRSVPFTQPGDRGYGGIDSEDIPLLQRMSPAMRPDALRPQLASGYRSIQYERNYYYQYTKDPYFSTDSLFNTMAIDRAFRTNTHLIYGKIEGKTFSVRLKNETGSCVLILPPHFPMPDEQSSGKSLEEAEWTYKVDPETGDFFAVIRAHGDDKVARGVSVNKVFGAISAAKSLEIVGVKKSLSKKQEKKVLQALGEIPFARFLGMPYEEFAEMARDEYGWAPNEEYYTSIPNDLKPAFRIY